MAKRHTIKQGESLANIATTYSFGNWRTIYDHPENAALRKKRGAPNQLRAGDVLFIPEPQSSVSSVNTDREQTLEISTARGIWELAWTPTKGICGEKVSLKGKTNLLGPIVHLALLPQQQVAAKPLRLSPKISGPQLSQLEWEIHDVPLMLPPSTTYPIIELAATTEQADVPSNVAVLSIQPLSDAVKQSYSQTHSWSGFSAHSRFDQKIEKFCCQVALKLSVLKAWGAYRVNLNSLGITGTAGGCPWSGYRWARATGANAMSPNEYYDGKAWQPIPSGFTGGTNESAVAFYRSGKQFLEIETGAPWPETFADYDFNAASYAAKRAQMEQVTYNTWSDKYFIRRCGCQSAAGTRCCIYTVELRLKLTEVTAPGPGVIALCPGALRSNTSVWFMDDSRAQVAAHESGHLIGLPDEYIGGGVDTSLNDDGASNGIDNNSIMGSGLSTVKKRHYRTIVEMTKKLISASYGRTYEYEAVEK